jgi:hypothetical protein
MKAYKEHKFIIFKFDDEKDVKYDLSSGVTIGKLGKPVKSLNSQLRGHDIYSVIDSFEDENYRAFLRFVLKNFVNDCRDAKKIKGLEVDRVKNIGTFLSRLHFHSRFEQYFAAGFVNVSPTMSLNMPDVPKRLLKLSRSYNIELTDKVVKIYNRDIKFFENVLALKCDSITLQDKINLLDIREHAWRYYHNTPSENFYELMREYHYSPVTLLKYIDHLMTYEALGLDNTLQELKDYCSMMSRISSRYDRFPRNFLTTHKIASRNYNRLKVNFNESWFESRIDETMEWKSGSFVVTYPATVQDIKDEAVQQNNCVASYIEKVINGECHIVFLRHRDEKDKSFVTMEVRDNLVVQAKGKFNRDVNREEADAIEKYNKYLEKRRSKVDANIVLNKELMEMATC